MNLLSNSTFQTTIAGVLHTPAVKYGSGTLTVVAASLGLNLPSNYLTVLQATDECGVYWDVVVEPDTTYVMSAYLASVIGTKVWFEAANTSTNPETILLTTTETVPETLGRHEFTFRTDHSTKTVRLSFYEPSGCGYSFNIAAVQFETGSVATDFNIGLSGILDNIAEGKAASITTDVISEETAATGVTIDGVLIKDSLDVSGIVAKTGNQTVAGVKTFSSVPIFPAAYQLNPNAHAQMTYAGGMLITIGSGGTIPWTTAVEDTGAMFPLTEIGTGTADTDTALHLIDADGTDFTTITSLLAPALWPVKNADTSAYAIVDSATAQDATLSEDIFPGGTEAFKVYDHACHITTAGLYMVDIRIAIAAAEADKNYLLELITDFATPVTVLSSRMDSAATGAIVLTLTGFVTLAAADVAYVKLSSNCAGLLTVGASQFTIAKL